MMDYKWVRITPGNMNWFNESIKKYKWIDSSTGKSLYVPFFQAKSKFMHLPSKDPNEDMTIHFGVRVTRRISRYIIPFVFNGFDSVGRTWAQLRLQSSESNGMALYLWGRSGLISKPEMGIYANLNTNYEFDIICEKEAMNIYCNGILRVSVSDFGHQPVQWGIGGSVDPNYDFDSDFEFYDIFCIKKAIEPDPNKPIGAVFHPEYCYHHMYDDFGTKIV